MAKWKRRALGWADLHWKTHVRYLELCNERNALLKQVAILEESHTAAVSDYNALLAWQRSVREAWAMLKLTSDQKEGGMYPTLTVGRNTYEACGRAIEGEPGKEET
jgi:hypothetical protein